MRLISILALGALCACATPYQREGFAGGYSEIELGQNKYLVSFSGNGFTSRSVVQRYAIQRAKQICAELDMDFSILQVGGDMSQFQLASMSNCYSSYGQTNCTHTPGGRINKHTAEVVVECLPQNTSADSPAVSDEPVKQAINQPTPASTTAPIEAKMEQPPQIMPTPSPIAQEPEPLPVKPGEERPFRFFLGVDLSSPYTMKFDSGAISTSSASYSGSAEFKLDSAAGISIGVEYLKVNSWGFNAALIAQGKRNLNSIKLIDKTTGDSSTINFTGDKATIQTNLIEVNAVYRWNYIYFPLGLNYSIPIFKQGAGATGTYETEGAYGGQIGIGCHLNRNVRFEALSRVVSLKFKTQSGATAVDYGTGITPSAELRFKYAF